MKEIVIDLETSVKNQGDGATGNMAASPYNYSNDIVLCGELEEGVVTITHGGLIPSFFHYAKKEKVMLIGHNIGFDLSYLMTRHADRWREVERNIHIWDTQQGAYLLSGQDHLFPSLDECCEEIGYELKDDKIKQYWKDGFDTEDIPQEELKEYLRHDLRATREVYNFQRRVLKEMPELETLAKVKMEDILMTTTMEVNGMRFDTMVAFNQSCELELELMEAHKISKDEAESVGFPKEVLFNPSSVDHVSAVLFGGVVKDKQPVVQYDEDGEEVKYKSGKRVGEVKTKIEEVEFHVKGIPYIASIDWNTKKPGVYSSADTVLRSLPKHKFVDTLLEIREKRKAKSTYFDGYASLVWPDGCIHPSLNNAATGTGRQSCTKPNLQNVTRSG